jgi:hypothetical protein
MGLRKGSYPPIFSSMVDNLWISFYVPISENARGILGAVTFFAKGRLISFCVQSGNIEVRVAHLNVAALHAKSLPNLMVLQNAVREQLESRPVNEP